MVILIEALPSEAHQSGYGDAQRTEQRHRLKTILQLALEATERTRTLVLQTSGLIESALLLLTLDRTIEQFTKVSSATQGCIGDAPPIPPPPRRSCGDVYLRQLCCVSGISPTRAQCIRGCYPTMGLLCTALAADPNEVAVGVGRLIRNAPLGRRFVASMTSVADNSQNVQKERSVVVFLAAHVISCGWYTCNYDFHMR